MEVTSQAQRQHDASGWQFEQYRKAKNITVETWTFYLKTVDTVILNWEKPLGVQTLILLNKTQDS